MAAAPGDPGSGPRDGPAGVSDARQSLENLKLERDAIVLYDSLARIEKDRRRAEAFRHIAGNERRHAGIWADKLRAAGLDVPEPDAPRFRVRAIIWIARLFGTRSVKDLVEALEGDEEDAYTGQASSPEAEAIAADEREHAEIWRRLSQDASVPAGVDRAAGDGDGHSTESGAAGSPSLEATAAGGPALDEAPGPAADAADAARATAQVRPADRRAIEAENAEEGIERARRARTPGDIAGGERWHRAGQSGTLRAVIFGVSDGLVSNLSLVAGVAGAAPDPHFILIAGIAGLLAGSFSMGAGEYISMTAQRELFERQIALERAELEAIPEEEEAELVAIYRSKGFSPEEAARIARRMFSDRRAALDTLVREELGLDPEELGSPWSAAIGSFFAFASGAVIPVVPYLFGGGAVVFAVSIGLSLVGAFAVGAGVSLLTGRGLVYSGVRQMLVSVLAAAVTFAVGSLLGVAARG